MKRTVCRLWWPEEHSSCKPRSNLLLFGWYIYDSYSIDIIVAVATPLSEILDASAQLDIEDILHCVNEKLPISLQESAAIKVLGHCDVDRSTANLMMDYQSNHFPFESDCKTPIGDKENVALDSPFSVRLTQQCRQGFSIEARSSENSGVWSCGCQKLDQSFEICRQSSLSCSIWLQLVSRSQRISQKETRLMPQLHHMHLNGYMLPISDVHVIMYELPVYGSHHFSLRCWGLTDQVEIPMKKPCWVEDLQKKTLLPDMDAVLLALNCATAAKELLESQLGIRNPLKHFRCISMLISILGHTMAMFVSSISTVIYLVLQFFHRLFSYGTKPGLMLSSEVFCHTLKNVHIRSCQFLYWPVFLGGCGLSSQSNVEYAHAVAVRKHSMWLSVAIDIFFGNILGVALLANIEAICFWISLTIRNITDNLLRSGCVWLMGVPAGFKLNTELAELLGIISLNAIQVFSTLLVFMSSFFRYAIVGIALSGILMGFTVPAALCIDVLKLTTLHISTLHLMISILYSQQIMALASLWRLFRNRKWNPLRQRLDSYDYNVEQHVVGSLLFTPLLLLLPTTSVFYVFFTILYTTISSVCIVIEIVISILHATPYAEILLWMAKRRWFPSGVWFEFMALPAVYTTTSHGLSDVRCSPSNLDDKSMDFSINGQPETVASLLHSNYATIGKIVGPRYRNVFSGVSPSFVKSSAHGILVGQRMSSTLQTCLPPTMPWMHISFKDYWMVCYSSVLSCRS